MKNKLFSDTRGVFFVVVTVLLTMVTVSNAQAQPMCYSEYYTGSQLVVEDDELNDMFTFQFDVWDDTYNGTSASGLTLAYDLATVQGPWLSGSIIVELSDFTGTESAFILAGLPGGSTILPLVSYDASDGYVLIADLDVSLIPYSGPSRGEFFVNVGIGSDGDANTISSFNIELVAIEVCTSVPEPATLFLMITGMVGLAGFRRKSKN